MVKTVIVVIALLSGLLGVVTYSTSEEPCHSMRDTQRTGVGIEEVCQKPANRKSWGELLADYLGYRGYSKSYALVVGISQYTGGYRDLPTKNDALRVRDFLINEAGFDYVHLLTDGRATTERIQELMVDTFPNRLRPSDRFLFYWSGHGVTRDAHGFLPVSDTPKDQHSKMISMDDIQRWNRYLPAKQSLFLLDACFGGLAGSVAKNSTTDLTIEQLAQPSHHLLTAGTDQEETIAGDRWGGSLFTAAVLDGLRGEADTASRFGKDGVVSLYELMIYVQKRVAIEKVQVGWNRSLTPQLRDLRHNIGEFFFLTTERKRATLEASGPAHSMEWVFGEPVVKSVASEASQPLPEADMIFIRGGYFSMGSNNADIETVLTECKPECTGKWFEAEMPQHRVYVDDFNMDKYEVTVGEYKKFLQATNGPAFPDIAKYAPTDRHPIVGVSWQEAVRYCQWAGKQLPTEAQWERAARGHQERRFYPWGNEPVNGTRTNFCDRNCTLTDKDSNHDDGHPYTAPVGTYADGRSSEGIYDLS
jgi:formylglycine-generating enzyme required for sulfatase activity